MKKLITVLFTVTFVLSAGGAAFAMGDDAQQQGDARVQHLNLGAMVIDGTLRRPAVQFHDQRERVKFERLMKIRKSFMPALMASGTDHVFK